MFFVLFFLTSTYLYTYEGQGRVLIVGHMYCRMLHCLENIITRVSRGSLDWWWSYSLFTSRPFLKTAGGIVLGSVAVSAVSAVSADVLPYISVAIKASFLKLGMCNICKNNIAKMFLDFLKILNCSFDRRFLNFWQKIVCARNLKNRWVDFHKIRTAGTSKLVDV